VKAGRAVAPSPVKLSPPSAVSGGPIVAQTPRKRRME
jgi:hypothetical protein